MANKTEHEIQNEIRLAVTRKNKATTLFRANVGKAWTGKKVVCSDDMITLHEARPFTTGLSVGFPDLFGLQTVKIMEDMVGKEVAVFVFLEVKRPGGRVMKAQERMTEHLRSLGARGGIVHSVDEAINVLKGKP